jgi:hypothetical protein
MTGAGRQARYRAAHADGSPKVRYRRPSDRRSRPQRWRDAVAELVNLQEEYRAWLDTLPGNLAESPTADALRTICDLDLSELESVEPPRGYDARAYCEGDRIKPPGWSTRSAKAAENAARYSLLRAVVQTVFVPS